MQDLIQHLEAKRDLDDRQIARAVAQLVSEAVDLDAKERFLAALRTKGETAQEIAGFVRELLARAVDPEIDPRRLNGPLLDVCGTGGDRLELFNVSTTVMFVLAAGGACVVKHGNRAITSKCGGADVLEALGVRIDLPPPALRRCVEETGLGFLFAPHYHPAFKAIAPVRKALAARGLTTIFNLLGPLLNPARPPRQLTGVFDPAALGKLAAAFRMLGREKAWVVHGTGADEVSLGGVTRVCEVTPQENREFEVRPEDAGLPPGDMNALRGGGREANARTLVGILDGSVRGPHRNMVVLNAAAALVVAGLTADLPSGAARAAEDLDSGLALQKLHALQSFGAGI
jgi:anthranilate phosphoribosyltransferase